jgi:hypothetical protein
MSNLFISVLFFTVEGTCVEYHIVGVLVEVIVSPLILLLLRDFLIDCRVKLICANNLFGRINVLELFSKL